MSIEIYLYVYNINNFQDVDNMVETNNMEEADNIKIEPRIKSETEEPQSSTTEYTNVYTDGVSKNNWRFIK